MSLKVNISSNLSFYAPYSQIFGGNSNFKIWIHGKIRLLAITVSDKNVFCPRMIWLIMNVFFASKSIMYPQNTILAFRLFELFFSSHEFPNTCCQRNYSSLVNGI